MMKLQMPSSRLTTHACALVLLGSLLSGCAPLMLGGAVTSALVASDRRTSGAQLEDQSIELRAATALHDQFGQRGNVSVTSYNRRVLLTGEVASEADKAQVGKLIGGLENVRGVVNELDVLGVSSLSQRSSDTLVTARVKAALLDARDVMGSVVKVVTTRGTVHLMGRVTPREADRITDIARNTSGVQRVVRVFEIISEEELARLQPKPAAPSPVTGGK
ncbi:MAG: hypothetical protein RLZZ352_1500 [Pseudomonadota bacterium]|jgi:osmotically-inducible protein OsmY